MKLGALIDPGEENEMIARLKSNPIIKPSDVKPSAEGYKVVGTFNPGAVKFEGDIVLLLRVAEVCEPREGYIRTPVYRFKNGGCYRDILEFEASDPEVDLSDSRCIVYRGERCLSSVSHIRVARSRDGIDFIVENEPFIYSTDESEEYGVEDARVTLVDGAYYITFTAISRDSWATALAVTKDFKSVEKKGLIFHPENKDVAIFPEKVKGKYIALHRPNNTEFGNPAIWYSESPDLIHWGNHRCLARTRDNQWESQRVGSGAPPIKTPEGWLVIYHGCGANSIYSLFCMLLDLEEPYRVIRRASTPLLAPTEPYETQGFFANVVFSNGIVEKDHKLYVYYGGSDKTTNVAITNVDSLLRSF